MLVWVEPIRDHFAENPFMASLAQIDKTTRLGAIVKGGIFYYYFYLQVLRNDEHTTLTVDGVSQSRTSRGKEFLFGKFATNSDVFVGGMPNWWVRLLLTTTTTTTTGDVLQVIKLSSLLGTESLQIHNRPVGHL